MTASEAPLRIAVLGINYAPEEIGIGRYTTDMACALAARGHAVEVIAGKPYYPQWQVPEAYRGGGWRRTVEQGVAITRCPHYVPANPTGLRRIAHLASFAAAALVPALALAARRRDHRPHIVLCLAPALLSVPVAWLAARLAGARLWVHVQDFEVEAAFATGLVRPKGLPARIALALENRLLRLADRVSTISPQMCARLVAKGVARERVLEIRNWAEPAKPLTHGTTAGSQGAGYREEWQLAEAKVALYSGNIANKQGIAIVVEAARLLADRKDILFVICGDGPNRTRLEQAAAGLANIRFHPLQPLARVAELLNLGAVHLLPQIPGAADLVLPSKLTNMLASGRPVVATAEPGTGLHDEIDGCGLCTPPGDPAALAAAVAGLVALAGPPAIYSLSRVYATDSSFIFNGIQMDYATGVSINTAQNGYVTDLQLMLVSLVALPLWLGRFRPLHFLPVVAFVLFKSGSGGRGPFIAALAVVGLLYLYERRMKLPSTKVLLGALAALAVFGMVGDDRGQFVRQTMGYDRDVAKVRTPVANRLEGMDFGNMEYFEFLVYVIPQRSGTYDYFLDNFQLFTEPVPRVWWSGKPIGEPFRRIYLTEYGRPYGMTRSLPGEGWYAMGWLGVAIWCGLWGWALGTIYRKYVTSAQTIIQTAAYMVFLPTLITGFRDGLLLTVVKQTWVYLAPVGLWWVIARLMNIPDAPTIRRALARGRDRGSSPPPQPEGERPRAALPPAVLRRRLALARPVAPGGDAASG